MPTTRHHYERRGPGEGTLMRHFLLLTSAPSALARRVFQRPAVALLVASRGAPTGFAPANPRAAFRAVTVATVAGPADAYLPRTTPTAIQPIALFAYLSYLLENKMNQRIRTVFAATIMTSFGAFAATGEMGTGIPNYGAR